MTFCFAWKNGNNIGMIADSLITLNTNENLLEKNNYTSFGENITEYNVIENELKILNLDDTIIAYAGDIKGIKNILLDYKNNKEEKNKLKRFRDAVESEARPENQTSFFIGFIDEEKKAQLYKIKTKGSKITEEKNISDCDFIGNSEYNAKDKIIEIYRGLKKIAPTPNILSLYLLVTLQKNGITTPTVPDGVGGIFKSIEIVDEKIEWNKNIRYIFYVPKNGKKEIKQEIGITFIDGFMIFQSKFSNNCICLGQPIDQYESEVKVKDGIYGVILKINDKIVDSQIIEGIEHIDKAIRDKMLKNLKQRILKDYIEKNYSKVIRDSFYDYYIFYNFINRDIVIVNNYNPKEEERGIFLTKQSIEGDDVYTKVQYSKRLEEILINGIPVDKENEDIKTEVIMFF